MNVLIAEDEAAIAESLSTGLRRHNHDTRVVATGSQALESYRDVDLVLLDLELPDMDSLEVCRTIRSERDIPLIAFTGRKTESDRVLGLQAGADDCLDIPYGFRELLARIDAVMRRAGAKPDPACIVRGPLRIDASTREVRLAGELVRTTRKEFDLLHCLARRPDSVVSRRELLSEIWDVPDGDVAGTQLGRTIDTHVSTLRGKLGSGGWIRTVRGIGFRIGREPDRAG